MEFDKAWLNYEFKGFKKINELLKNNCLEIPKERGGLYCFKRIHWECRNSLYWSSRW